MDSGNSAQPGGSIAKAVDNLEQMFTKADNEITYLTRKLSFQLDYGQEGKIEPNPVRLMDRVEEIKKEYSTLTQDIEQIQQTQKETVEFFRSQLLKMTDMLQRLETQTGAPAALSSSDVQQFDQLAQMIGLSKEDLLPACPPAPGTVTTVVQTEEPTPASSASASCSPSESASSESCESPAEKDIAAMPQLSPFDCRAGSAEFIPLSQEEFMSVSELIRLRAKLEEVNKTYKLLWQHFKEEGNSEPLTPRDMNAKGMKVTGATGEAKLKILRALKLCQISKTGTVTLT